ncbi:hypothetical protein HZH66_013396 [Vespula vulgaris]|uniref:Reverse transcriptase domain-containing protein n=1 Tax=Vespula vulgaris TaxID=7454 RepID=A0A834J9N1_VESVU|nr:hypothetical protein HZH66_013396 [Vespula vulgaris]
MVELKQELLILGHEILNISNIRHNKILQPSSLFFIELKQKHNNKEIYQVKTLLNSIIQREPPYKKKEIKQLIDKPGKPPHETLSYHPISLLPIFSKIFEKLLLKCIEFILKETNLIPDHQFGFRKQHSTIQQIHSLVDHFGTAESSTKNKVLPHPLNVILHFYLSNRKFKIQFQGIITPAHHIHSGVPQRSVLGPILYFIHTADIPVSTKVTTATFIDTAILASHDDLILVIRNLQEHLDVI